MLVPLSTTEQTVNDLVQRNEDFHRPGAASFAALIAFSMKAQVSASLRSDSFCPEGAIGLSLGF